VLAVPYRPLSSPLMGLLLGALAITALGAVDDLRALPGRLKFPLIYAAASVPVWFGMTTSFLTNPFDGSVVSLGLVGDVLTVLWLGSMAIAMNSIDGVDGLAAGIATITAATLLTAGATRGDGSMMTVVAAVGGAALGFLRHNFNPARIFMGDTGSLFLGYALAALGIKLRFESSYVITWMIPVLILGIPIFDTTLVVISRLRRGKRELAAGDFTNEDDLAALAPRFDPDGHWHAPPQPWHAETPEALMANGELQAVLAKAIDALPPNQRAALTLRDVAGQPLEEICNALDVSATNARVLLHRARLRVWAAVEAYQRGENV